jgi:hypothetical protein
MAHSVLTHTSPFSKLTTMQMMSQVSITRTNTLHNTFFCTATQLPEEQNVLTSNIRSCMTPPSQCFQLTKKKKGSLCILLGL